MFFSILKIRFYMKAVDLVLGKYMKKFLLTLASMVLLNINMQYYAFSSEWIKKQEDKSDIELIIKQIQNINYVEKLETKTKKENNKNTKDTKTKNYNPLNDSKLIVKDKTKYGDLLIKENHSNPYYYNVILKNIPKKICQKIISDHKIKNRAKFIQLSNMSLDMESKMKEAFMDSKEICYQKTKVTLVFKKEE